MSKTATVNMDPDSDDFLRIDMHNGVSDVIARHDTLHNEAMKRQAVVNDPATINVERIMNEYMQAYGVSALTSAMKRVKTYQRKVRMYQRRINVSTYMMQELERRYDTRVEY